MKNKQKKLQLSSSRIVTDQELKLMKIEYLSKHGFRRDAVSWTNGSKRVRTSLVDDAETPYRVFVNLVSKSIQAGKNNKLEKPISKKKRKSKLNRNSDLERSQDALDYRLPGSYGTGKRR